MSEGFNVSLGSIVSDVESQSPNVDSFRADAGTPGVSVDAFIPDQSSQRLFLDAFSTGIDTFKALDQNYRTMEEIKLRKTIR